VSTVWKVIRVILGAAGWLLLFLLVFPVRADVLLEDAVLHVDIRYLFMKFRLLPGRKSGDGKASEQARNDSENAPADAEKPEENAPDESGGEQKDDGKSGSGSHKSVSETITRIKDLLSPLLRPGWWLLRMLTRTIRIKDMSVIIDVTGSDPASIGFRSGLQWALVGNFMKLLGLIFGKNVTYGDVTVMPCFDRQAEKKEKLSFSACTVPIVILLLVLGFALAYLFGLIKKKLSFGGKKNVN